MPRAGQVKPTVQERLSDRIAIGVLTSTFPPELVDRVVAEAGRPLCGHRTSAPSDPDVAGWLRAGGARFGTSLGA